MHETLKGIVLRTVKFKDSQQIVDLFTESRGRMSFVTGIAHGVRKSGAKSALWRPLSLLEFEADVRPSGRLPHPRDVRPYTVWTDLPYNPAKAAIALFLTEVLTNVLRDGLADPPLYHYLEDSLQWLDTAQHDYANFHLVFLIRLTRFVGIAPNLDGHPASHACFDLLSGTFCQGEPSHPHFLRPDEAGRLPLLTRMNYANMHLFRLSAGQRQRILTVLNDYYRLHLPPFPELRSLSVLHELFL